MRKDNLLKAGRNKIARAMIVLLAAMALLGTLSLPQSAAGLNRVDAVEMPGLIGSNNVAFAYGRYAIVAPYASSTQVEDDNADLSQLDNNFLYLIDLKKPDREPKRKQLPAYYPTKILFDPETSIAYVRATRYEVKEGVLQEIDVIAYVHINLDEDKQPNFDAAVPMIDIVGVDEDFSSDAPLDFALNGKGSLLAFTNGATVFILNLSDGVLNKIDIVPPSEYNTDSSISYLDIDRASDTLIVCWNKRTKNSDDRYVNSSEISFYRLNDNGAVDLLKRAYPERLPNNSYLTQGSNVAISPGEGGPASAFFVSSDGSLCGVDFDGGVIPAEVKSLYTFPELAQEVKNIEDPNGSPRLVRYDAAKRVVSIVKQGFTAQIKRPAGGRPRRVRINRELNLHVDLEDSAVVLAKLNKRGKVISTNSFTNPFIGEGGLSNFTMAEGDRMMVATYSGKLFSVGLADSIDEAKLEGLGELGARIEHIAFYADRESLVAVNSLKPDANGDGIEDPGSLVIAKVGEVSTQLKSVIQAIMPAAAVVGAPTPSIRRPCNVKR